MQTVAAETSNVRSVSETFETADVPPPASAQPSTTWLGSGRAIITTSGRIIEADPELAAWLGVNPASLVARNLADVLGGLHANWATTVRQHLGQTGTFQTVALVSRDTVPAHYRLELTRHSERIVVQIASAIPSTVDLAEGPAHEVLRHPRAQQEMHARLVRAESRLDTLMQRWPGVIFSQRADFSYHFVSPQMEQLTGIAAAQWRQQPQLFWEVIHEADADEVRSRIHRSTLLRQPMSFTYRIRHATTGSVTYLLEHRDPVVTANGLVLGYEGFWIDVTRQTIAERRLSSAAWKETLSVLTMGLAHDFRNLMAGIGALSEQFLSQLEPGHAFAENMTLIMNNSRQASQLVHRIITLHHGKPGERNYHDLNDLLKEVSELTAKIIPRRIRMEVSTHAGSLPVYLDAVEFRQVVINLLLNAVDAMPDRGQLFVSSSLHESLPAWEHACGTPPRLPAVALTIRDTGTGVKPHHLPNLFDPFFTTKALNKGSGLGLYNARLFAEKHQGAISVASTVGAGATFRVWLPVADFTEGEREFAARRSERRSLLFVGADGRASESTVEFLRTAGYHVVVAHSVELARAMLESAEYPFAGIFVQAGDQAGDGGELLAAAAAGAPPLKTILQIVGRNEDEFDSDLLRRADLLLGSDLSQAAILQRLEALLGGASA